MPSGEEYRRRAEDLALQAQRALTSAGRAQLARLADVFGALAEQTADNVGPRDRTPPTSKSRRRAFLDWLSTPVEKLG